MNFSARLNEVQEELLHYPGVGVSKMLKFYLKVFYVMGKALTGELSCLCDRSETWVMNLSGRVKLKAIINIEP